MTVEQENTNWDADNPFDAETWAQLPPLLAHLPEPIHINVWGDANAAATDAAAIQVCQTLADQFDTITMQNLPRRINYDYWPVLGIMRGTPDAYEDVGVRIIGLPQGFGMTSFITAVQAVSFKGMTSEALTRIQLAKLKKDIRFELITADDNEAGALMAQPLLNMAAASAQIRVFMIMAEQFPVIIERYSVNYLPHTVINGRVHMEGVMAEKEILEHIAKVV